MTTLANAHNELMNRARHADEARTPDARLLESLASVADYLRRIVDHGGAIWHYRTEKAGELVAAAMRVERDAFAGLAIDGDTDDETLELLYRLHTIADQVVTELSAARWTITRAGSLDRTQIAELSRAGVALVAIIDKLAATAVEDGAR